MKVIFNLSLVFFIKFIMFLDIKGKSEKIIGNKIKCRKCGDIIEY